MENNLYQYSFFDYIDKIDNNLCKAEATQHNCLQKNINLITLNKFNNYNLDAYYNDVKVYGLETTWASICQYLLQSKNITNGILKISNLGELYEEGLAIVDKQQKKDVGKYYTPTDVALVMSKWFEGLHGDNICDVACGTGQLILTYFDYIGVEKTKQILSEGRLYLYDIDAIALNICKTIILVKYGREFAIKIHDVRCDFLDKSITLPPNCKVISNPPYSCFTDILNDWEITEVLLNTKEMYSVFMEKILFQSESSVIITPYSFIGGSKFYSLRKVLNNKNGFIVSFDNVPGNIFHGKKYGVFNTNTSNSVRASITVIENKPNKKGFRVSPLIRFKNEERNDLLQCNVLESFIDNDYQIISKDKQMYSKCDKRLRHIFNKWNNSSKKLLCEYVQNSGKYTIYMPNTCRYFTTASNRMLDRSGQIILNFNDEDIFNFVYCLLNSSFAYWYWRIYDGGITYPKKLLLKMPIFYDKLSDDDKMFFKDLTKEMLSVSEQYIVHKSNVGMQENIKYPRYYRDKINGRLLKILDVKDDTTIFDIVHSNTAMEINI